MVKKENDRDQIEFEIWCDEKRRLIRLQQIISYTISIFLMLATAFVIIAMLFFEGFANVWTATLLFQCLMMLVIVLKAILRQNPARTRVHD